MNTLSLLPHNEAAYHKAMSHLETHRKVAVVQPCGTGKSYVGGAIASHFKKVLVVAPNDYVLGQAVATTPHADTATYSYLAICNDMPTGYDLIWFDELHRIGAPTWMGGVDRLIEANPDAKILGTTATPERALEQRDMADEFFDGDVVSSMTLTDAWVDHVLRVPKYVIGVVSMDSTQSDYAERISKSTRINESQKKEATAFLDNIVRDWSYSYGVPRILKKYIDGDVERMIVFAQTIAKLDEVVSSIGPWFNEAGVKLANIYTVHSGIGAEAKRQMSAFENDTTEGVKVLVSVDMLNEGVHVSRVDAVMLLRSTISKNLYIQQIGRCFAVGQKHQPIILDLADNLTSACGYEGIYDAQSRYNSGAASVPSDRTPDEFIVIDTLKETREVIAMIDRQIEKCSHTFEECLESAKKYTYKAAWMNGDSALYNFAYKRKDWYEKCTAHMTDRCHSWTREECQEIALKFASKRDFREAQSAIYHYADKHGFLNEICSHMIPTKCRWTKEKAIEAMKLCNTRSEFMHKYAGAYGYALSHGMKPVLDEFFGAPKHTKSPRSYMPIKTYTVEECTDIAKQYKTRSEFKAKNSSAFSYTIKMGWQDVVMAHFAPVFRWTKELAIEEAKKYTTLRDLTRANEGLYAAILKHGWQQDALAHIIKATKIWTKEEIVEEAKKYESRSAFCQGSSAAYCWARKHKILDEVCSHMNPRVVIWTHEKARQAALECHTRSEFNKRFPGAINYAVKNGIYEEICSHFPKVKEWTLEECMSIASRYSMRVQMKTAEPKAYDAIIAHKWGDVCFAHMVFRGSKLSKEECIAEAKKYSNKTDFYKNASKHYNIAKRNGWFEECTAHMPKDS